MAYNQQHSDHFYAHGNTMPNIHVVDNRERDNTNSTTTSTSSSTMGYNFGPFSAPVNGIHAMDIHYGMMGNHMDAYYYGNPQMGGVNPNMGGVFGAPNTPNMYRGKNGYKMPLTAAQRKAEETKGKGKGKGTKNKTSKDVSKKESASKKQSRPTSPDNKPKIVMERTSIPEDERNLKFKDASEQPIIPDPNNDPHRANCHNPNNPLYWTQRGLEVPEDLNTAAAEIAAARRAEGRARHLACQDKAIKNGKRKGKGLYSHYLWADKWAGQKYAFYGTPRNPHVGGPLHSSAPAAQNAYQISPLAEAHAKYFKPVGKGAGQPTSPIDSKDANASNLAMSGVASFYRQAFNTLSTNDMVPSAVSTLLLGSSKDGGKGEGIDVSDFGSAEQIPDLVRSMSAKMEGADIVDAVGRCLVKYPGVPGPMIPKSPKKKKSKTEKAAERAAAEKQQQEEEAQKEAQKNSLPAGLQKALTETGKNDLVEDSTISTRCPDTETSLGMTTTSLDRFDGDRMVHHEEEGFEAFDSPVLAAGEVKVLDLDSTPSPFQLATPPKSPKSPASFASEIPSPRSRSPMNKPSTDIAELRKQLRAKATLTSSSITTSRSPKLTEKDGNLFSRFFSRF